MNRAFWMFLVLGLAAGSSLAGTVLVDFSALPEAINIAKPATFTIDSVRMQYDPGGIDPLNPPPACAFIGGAGGGVQWDGACVGAQVDSAGVAGTTDGGYNLGFASLAWGLHVSYGLFSLAVPAPDPGLYGVTAFFFRGIDLIDFALSVADPQTQTGMLDYSGPAFDTAVLHFSPYSEPDLITGVPNGETWMNVSQLSFDTPEPAAFLLAGSALLGLGMLRRRSR